MNTLQDYLQPVPEEFQAEAIVRLSGEADALAELKMAVTIALMENWRALLLVDEHDQPIGVVATEELERDLEADLAQPGQLGSGVPDVPTFPPPPLIYVCPSHPQEHPRHFLARRGPTPHCNVCRPPRPCIEWASRNG